MNPIEKRHENIHDEMKRQRKEAQELAKNYKDIKKIKYDLKK